MSKEFKIPKQNKATKKMKEIKRQAGKTKANKQTNKKIME